MHKKLCRFDIKLFADIFTDFNQLFAALIVLAGIRFVNMVNARQMGGERLTTSAVAFGFWQRLGFNQLLKLGLNRRQVCCDFIKYV
jgi:hypothetical protein